MPEDQHNPRFALRASHTRAERRRECYPDAPVQNVADPAASSAAARSGRADVLSRLKSEQGATDAPIVAASLDRFALRPERYPVRCFHDEIFFLDHILSLRIWAQPVSHWYGHLPHLWTTGAMRDIEARLAPELAIARRNRFRNPETDGMISADESRQVRDRPQSFLIVS
jgi:hypothetical protein